MRRNRRQPAAAKKTLTAGLSPVELLRLIQWNTTKIHATYSMEEAISKADALEAIF